MSREFLRTGRCLRDLVPGFERPCGVHSQAHRSRGTRDELTRFAYVEQCPTEIEEDRPDAHAYPSVSVRGMAAWMSLSIAGLRLTVTPRKRIVPHDRCNHRLLDGFEKQALYQCPGALSEGRPAVRPAASRRCSSAVLKLP